MQPALILPEHAVRPCHRARLTPCAAGTPHASAEGVRARRCPLGGDAARRDRRRADHLPHRAAPSGHGVVANGWYFRDSGDQVLAAVEPARAGAEGVGDRASDATRASPAPTCSGGTRCTRRPTTRSRRGRCTRRRPQAARTSAPSPATLRDELQRELGQFPLFKFWGPATGIEATRGSPTPRCCVDAQHDPTLSLVYLPHLDYVLQRIGPGLTRGVASDLARAGRGLRRADRPLRGPRRAGDRAVRVRHRAGVAGRCT